MKRLSNLLSQRREWKVMLFGLQVEPLEVVGVRAHHGLSVEIAPCASKSHIFFLSSRIASPTKMCRSLPGRSEPRGGSHRRQQGPCIRQNAQAHLGLGTHLNAAGFAPSHSVPGWKGSLRPRGQFPLLQIFCAFLGHCSL